MLPKRQRASASGGPCLIKGNFAKTLLNRSQFHGGIKMDHFRTVIFTIILLSQVLFFGCSANEPKDQWIMKLYNQNWNAESGKSVAVTLDGGFLIAGTGSRANSVIQTCIAKFGKEGNLEWAKTYCNPRFYYKVAAVLQTSEGGYILAGETNSNDGNGNSDIWVLKLTPNGNIEWQNTYGGPNMDGSSSLLQTPDGGYVVAGGTYSFGAGDCDIWILKLNSKGAIQWQKTYGGKRKDGDTPYRMFDNGGGYQASFRSKLESNFELTCMVSQTSDSGYVVVAPTESFDENGKSKIWVFKLDTNGDIQWQKTYGGAGYNSSHSILETTDGGYVVAGVTDSFTNISQRLGAWLLKLGKNGDIQWQRAYTGNGKETFSSVLQTSDGGYFLSGETSSFGNGWSNIWCIRTNPFGKIQWQKTYGLERWGWPSCVKAGRDRTFIITAEFYVNARLPADTDKTEMYVLKITDEGGTAKCPLSTISTAEVLTTTGVTEQTNCVCRTTKVIPKQSDAVAMDQELIVNRVWSSK
jgi:hypothetical protein